jgi:hypothetical protein
MNYKIKNRRIKTGSYFVTVDGVTIARVDYAGSHLDDYPWELLFEEGVTLAEPYRGSGVFDTKREAVDCAVYHYVGPERYWDQEA